MLEFAVYDQDDGFVDTVVPNTVHAELIQNGVSFGELDFDRTVDASILRPGYRVRMFVDGSDEESLAGPIVHRTRTRGGVLLRVEDDFRVFMNLGYPTTTSPGTGSAATLPAAYRRYTGTTEQVVKQVCSDLSTRLGYGWTIPPAVLTGLVSNRRVEFRFHPLLDKLVDLLDADKLTWTLRGGVVDVHRGELFPQVLTEDSGILGDYVLEESFPEATRVVAGGEGEGIARVFQRRVDSARETEYGAVVEVFRDSRMAQGVTDLTTDLVEALEDGAPRVSVSSELIQNDFFRFGEYRLGDRVALDIEGVQVEEVIRSVVIESTPDEGERFVPTIGVLEDDADTKLGKQVARMGRAARDLRRL